MAVLKDLIVHGRSRFLNGAQFNTINAESIGANEGIFNKLIATTLDAKEVTIDDLRANNATIVGLLDVQGQMQTNSWTNANIATIDGSFYICPTISSEATVTTSGTTQTSDNKFVYNSSGGTIILTGTWATTGSLYLNNTAANWNLYSKVMITGEVLIGNEWTPIGTIRGVLQGINTSNHTITIGSLSSNITVGADGTINSLPAILFLVTSGTTYSARKLKVSLYEYNTAGTSSGATNLIGIMMTTSGTHGFTYLDIYNGLNSKTSYTSMIDNATKATEPMVRIGNLNGLPNIVTNGTADTQPSGWGIYTTNGYFKGKIVSNAGKIAGWNISDTALYNGSTGINNTTTGAYLGYATNNTGLNVSGGSAATTITIANSNFTKTINGTSYSTLRVAIGSNFGMDSSGNIYANGANITNINANNISTNMLSAMQAVVSNLSVLRADMGSITAGSISRGNNSINFNQDLATLEFKNASTWTSATQGIKYDSNGLAVKGAIDATSFAARDSDQKIRAMVTTDGLLVYNDTENLVASLGSIVQIGNLNGYHTIIEDASFKIINIGDDVFSIDTAGETKTEAKDTVYLSRSTVWSSASGTVKTRNIKAAFYYDVSYTITITPWSESGTPTTFTVVGTSSALPSSRTITNGDCVTTFSYSVLSDSTYRVTIEQTTLTNTHIDMGVLGYVWEGYYDRVEGSYTRTFTVPILNFDGDIKADGNMRIGSSGASTAWLRANTINNVDNYYIGLQFYDPGDEYGQIVRLGAGASTIIGAGESSTAIYDNNINSAATSAEGLHLSSDGAIYLYTNCNTIANRKQTYIDANGVLSVANNLIMPDSSAIFFKDATVGNINTIAWNSSDQLVIGYGQKTGGFNTYIEGQTVTLMSNANITFTTGGSSMNVYTNGYYSAAGSYSQTTSSSANLNVASAGKICRSTASSRKYKVNIKSLSTSSINAHKLYDLPVVEFRYKDGYISDTKDRRATAQIPGFIAEDVAEIYPIAAEYVNNEVEDWSFRYIIPPMLKLIQEQKQEIDELKNKVAKLEGDK